MKVLLAVVAVLGVIVVTATPTQAAIIPDTGVAAPGSTDPAWSVMWRPIAPDGTSFGAAANAALVSSPPSPWQPNIPGTNNWIGVNSAATISGATGNGSQRYEYAFTTEIELTSGQVVKGAIGYDNFFIGGFVDGDFNDQTGSYTPGTQVVSPSSLLGPGKENKAGFCRDDDGFLPSRSHPTCTVNFEFDLPAGRHDLTFVIRGDGVTDGFFLNQQGVTLVPRALPEPASLLLLGILLAGLGFSRRLRRQVQSVAPACER